MATLTDLGARVYSAPTGATDALKTAVGVLGIGSALPAHVVPNAPIAARAALSEDWIVQRTGILERRVAGAGLLPSQLGAASARRALAMAGIEAAEVGFLLCCTATPDRPIPATSCLILRELGVSGPPAMDLVAGCTGFLYGLRTADALLRSDPALGNVLLVSTEFMNLWRNPDDYQTCALFGDAAAAVVLGRVGGGAGLLGSVLHADGALADLIQVQAGGVAEPTSAESVAGGRHYLEMRGREVFRHAVEKMISSCRELLDAHGVKPRDLDLVVPHQANLRILEAIAQRFGIADKLYINIERFGNTASATIPLALDECVKAGRLKRGNLVMVTSFGAGATWGAALLRW